MNSKNLLQRIGGIVLASLLLCGVGIISTAVRHKGAVVVSTAVDFMEAGFTAVATPAYLLAQGLGTTDILTATTVILTATTASTSSVTVKQRIPRGTMMG